MSSEETGDEEQPAEGAVEASAAQEGGAETSNASSEGGNGAAPEPGASEPPPEPAEPTLEEQLAEAQGRASAMREKMMRVAADFENFRRRSGKEVDDARKRGAQDMVKDLLAVFDNLERATSTVDDATDVAMIAEGLRMVHKQFIDVLGKRGIQRVDALGKAFDPSVHEAIQYDHSDTHAAGLVMNELQPGYVMGGQLLRPAMVMVSRGPALAEIVGPEPEAAPTHVDATGDGDAAADEASDAPVVEDAAAANDGGPETAT